MHAYPFSVFKRADRACYSVAFKNEAGGYLPPISTGMRTEKDAIAEAFRMMKHGIPDRRKKETLQTLELKAFARKIHTAAEAKVLMDELQRLGHVKRYVIAGTENATPLMGFLANFWNWDTSPYVQEKLRADHGIHRRYVKSMGLTAALHWAPFFKDRYLGEVTQEMLDGFLTQIGKLELSASRKNQIFLAGTIPLRWAFAKKMIDSDPTRGHMLFTAKTEKRNIPTPAMAAAMFAAKWEDDRDMLGNLLAAVTGMRCGEILALRLSDLRGDRIRVSASWNAWDGRKTTKTNETRTVEFAFPEMMQALHALAQRNPWGLSDASYIFWSGSSAEKPMHGQRLIRSLRSALANTGLTEEQAGKYVFHGWRHFYTSYMIKELDKKLLKSQTGHKTDRMLGHYGDHEIDGEREMIQAVQQKAFAGIMPNLPAQDCAAPAA